MDAAPIHLQLRKALLLECASGKFSPGQRFYSNRKVCRLWKVSNTTATSSINWLVNMKVLEPRPRSGYYLLSQSARRARLLLHKQPEMALPSPQVFSTRRFQLLNGGSERPIRKLALVLYGNEPANGFLETESENPVYKNVWSRSFFEGVIERGFDFQCFLNNGNLVQQRLIARRVLEHRVDGVAVFMRTWKLPLSPMVQSLLSANIPVVRVFGDSETTEVPTVNINNVGIGYEAGKRFRRNGHRRVGVLVESRDCRDFSDRAEGCRFALEESEGEATLAVLKCSENRPIPARIRDLFLDPARRPTAVFATRIELFRNLEPMLNDLGLRVPEDVSVIVCGGVPFIPGMAKPLDTLLIDFFSIGRLAVETLVDLMEGKLAQRDQLVEAAYHRTGSVVGAPEPGARKVVRKQ